MPEFKPIAPKPLSEVESKTKYTVSGKAGNTSVKKSEKLVGGRADNRPDSDFDPEQLKIGIKVEREHTKDEAKAKEVAKDHLAEIPDYYKRLTDMEAKASKDIKKSFSRVNELVKSAKASLRDAIDEDDMDIKKTTDPGTSSADHDPLAEAKKNSTPAGKAVASGLQNLRDKVTKALKASNIIGLSKRQRLDAVYQAGLMEGRKNYFEVEPVDLTGDLNVGIEKSRERPLYEPLAVPIRRVETPFDIPPKKCGDHTYSTTKAANIEAKPFWRR